jgi:hypothetical protein
MKRTKRTSQPKKKAKKKQVKTTAAQKKSKKQVKTTATQKKSKKKAPSALPSILAVAIGDPNNSRPIDSIPGLSFPNPCRPYVSAMVGQLMNQPTPRLLGRDYVIDYRECFEGEEKFTVTTNPALILCMSTPVMMAAVAVANNLIPVVGVTSNPGAFPGNVCGVNAQRTNNPFATYYIHFRNSLGPTPPTITLLNRTGSPVSNSCRDEILRHVTVPVAEVNPTTADPRTAIVNAINTVPQNSGLLVLPVDVFFGFYETINTAAESRNLTVFWPAEEFARHGQPHFGSSQVECGQIFGVQVDFILTNNVVPTGGAQWKTVNPR